MANSSGITGDHVRAVRTALGYTRSELAKQLGYSYAAITAAEALGNKQTTAGIAHVVQSRFPAELVQARRDLRAFTASVPTVPAIASDIDSMLATLRERMFREGIERIVLEVKVSSDIVRAA